MGKKVSKVIELNNLKNKPRNVYDADFKRQVVDVFDQNQDYKLFRFNPDFKKIKMVDFKGSYNVKKTFTN